MRLLPVHALYQVLLEGLAQALPLFVTPDDAALVARVRLDHYLQLVRAELHLAINSGVAVSACVEHARSRVPFWTDGTIAHLLSDRSNDRNCVRTCGRTQPASTGSVRCPRPTGQ